MDVIIFSITIKLGMKGMGHFFKLQGKIEMSSIEMPKIDTNNVYKINLEQ